MHEEENQRQRYIIRGGHSRNCKRWQHIVGLAWIESDYGGGGEGRGAWVPQSLSWMAVNSSNQWDFNDINKISFTVISVTWKTSANWKRQPRKKRTDKESRTDIIVKKDIDNLVKTTQWTNRLIQHAFIYTTTNCISNWQCLLLLRSS